MTNSKFFDLFPTTIYLEFLDIEIINRLDNIIVPRLSNLEDKGHVLTDFYKPNIVNSNEIQFFIDLIFDRSKKYCDKTLFLEPTKIQYWIQDYKVNQNHQLHTHPYSSISGIYYLRANEHAGKLRMVTPNPYTINTNYKSEVPPLDYELTPQKGLLILFPSWLSHEVLPSLNKECIRTCIAFNLNND